MKFKIVEENHFEEISKFISYQKYRTCNYTIGGIYMWRNYYNFQYVIEDDMLFLKGKVNEEEVFFVPVGNGELTIALDKLYDYSIEFNKKFQFYFVPESTTKLLESRYNLKSEVIDNWFDYVYDIDSLDDLKGNKYSGQRNHVNKFKKLFPNYLYKEITNDDIPRCIDFLSHYHKVSIISNTHLASVEEKVSIDLLSNFRKLNLIGGMIEVNNKIIALTIGEIVDDTLYVHIEKALREYNGIYAVINIEFVKNNNNDYLKYVNREEDVGDFGLRKAKESYHPTMLLQKYFIK